MTKIPVKRAHHQNMLLVCTKFVLRICCNAMVAFIINHTIPYMYQKSQTFITSYFVPSRVYNDNSLSSWIISSVLTNKSWYNNESESVSNQRIHFPMDRDAHDFHALFQYMFIRGYKIARLSSHSLIRN